LKDKKLSIEAKKPFFILENSMTGNKSENDGIEPENIGLAYRQKEANASSCPRVLEGLDDDRTLRNRNEHIVKDVYHFFQSFKGLPCEIFPDWLSRKDSVDHWQN
jgi:hypothetical protein